MTHDKFQILKPNLIGLAIVAIPFLIYLMMRS